MRLAISLAEPITSECYSHNRDCHNNLEKRADVWGRVPMLSAFTQFPAVHYYTSLM